MFRHTPRFTFTILLTLITLIVSTALSPRGGSTGVSAASVPASGAYDTFECHKVWKTKGTNNSFISCVTNITHLAAIFNTPAERAEIAGVLIPLAIVMIVVIVFPIFLALRYCVDFCGSYKRRPGYFCYGGEEWDGIEERVKDHFYDATDANCLRATSYLSLLFAFVPMILLLVGTGHVQEGYNTLFGEIYKVVGWAETKEKSMKKLVKRDGNFIAPINASFFNQLTGAVSTYKTDIERVNEINKNFIDIIKIAAIVFALVPMGCLVANALFAAFDIRSTWPLLNSFLVFICLIFYAVIASACLMLGVLTDRICGERNAFLAGEPSLGDYYLVPQCEEAVAFDSVRNTLTHAKGTVAVAACTSLQTHCRTFDAFVANPKIFYCPHLTSPSTQCTTNAAKNTIFANANVRVLSGGPSCTAAPCDLKGCQSSCGTTASKGYATTVINAGDDSTNIHKAMNIFNSELGNCTALVRRAFSYLESCSAIRSSVFFVGVGCSIFTGLFVIALVVIFRGQKRFFKPIHVMTEEEEEAAKRAKILGNVGVSPGNTPQTRSIEPFG